MKIIKTDIIHFIKIKSCTLRNSTKKMKRPINTEKMRTRARKVCLLVCLNSSWHSTLKEQRWASAWRTRGTHRAREFPSSFVLGNYSLRKAGSHWWVVYHRHAILQVHCNLYGPLSTKGCDENESVSMATVFGFVLVGWGDEILLRVVYDSFPFHF